MDTIIQQAIDAAYLRARSEAEAALAAHTKGLDERLGQLSTRIQRLEQAVTALGNVRGQAPAPAPRSPLGRPVARAPGS